MSVQSRKLNWLKQRIRKLREREIGERSRWKRRGIEAFRWALMLYHEFLRDEVKIRAESLAFLLIFSLLPLIAGGFFIFTLFAQVGMVQDAMQSVLSNFLSTIPDEHRGFVLDYVLHFKDAYLASIRDKSGSIGIFALAVLAWVGIATFDNIDRTLNFIWSSDRARPFGEQVRNFLVISVAAPFVLIATFSVPLILKKIPATAFLLDQIPLLGYLMNSVLAPLLVVGTFYLLYRYVPVRHVRWKSALAGALFSAVLLGLANYGVHYYFKVGTQTAYGKAAVVPLIAFYIYVVWIIVILGAELSYLMQNQRDILASADFVPSFREGEGLLYTLSSLLVAHRNGKPVPFDRLLDETRLESGQLHGILDFLERRHLSIEALVTENAGSEGAYVLAKDVTELDLGDLLRQFYGTRAATDGHVHAIWAEGLKTWTKHFEGMTVAQLVDEPKKKPRRP